MTSHKCRNASVFIFALTGLSVTTVGCNRDTVRVLTDAILATSDSTVFLSAFWSRVEERTPIAIDPIGGGIFLYWIGEEGNACHGTAGVSGQPGPYFVADAFDAQAFTAAQNYEYVTDAQLEQFQQITLRPGEWDYEPSGLYLAQYTNVMWRNRDDGTAFMDRMNHRFSIPRVVSLDAPISFSLMPVHAYGREECDQAQLLILPNLAPATGQHPDKCLVKAVPTTVSMTVEERLDYCAVSLPHGLP